MEAYYEGAREKMINILHNRFTVDEEWCFGAFSKHINSQSRVLVLALSFRDTKIANSAQWDIYYGKNTGIYSAGIVESFAPYGMSEANFEWIHYFEDTAQTAKHKVKNADVLYFPGGLPDKMYLRILELDLLEDIRKHPGVVIGFSAGALIQLSEYHITPDKDYPNYCYEKGCGLIDAFGIEVHYDATNEIQRESIRRFMMEKKKPLYAIADDGAVIVADGCVSTVGNVAFFDISENGV